MTAAGQLPWPEQWRSRVTRWVGPAVAAVLGAMCLVGTGAAARSGDVLPAVLLAVFGAASWAGAVGGFCLRVMPYRRTGSAARSVVSDGAPALRVPYSPTFTAALTAGCLTVFVGSAVLGAGALVPGTTLFAEVSLLGTAGCLALAVGAGALLVRLSSANITRCGIELSAAGVLHRSWVFRELVSWDQVYDVRAAEGLGGRGSRAPMVHIHAMRVAGEHTAVARTPPRSGSGEPGAGSTMEIRVAWLAVSPPLVLWLLRYYHAHPHARAELGMDASLQRVARAAAGLEVADP